MRESIYHINNGSVSTKWNEKFVLPYTCWLDHSEMCLIVDEVGADLSQKGYGYFGRAKYACEKGIHA